MQIPHENTDAGQEEMAAFNRDPDTWPFREYWQTNDARFVELTAFIDRVANGKIVVSTDIVAQCREAVLQINQINHVMTELSKAVGQASLVSAMNIAYTYDARTATARNSLHLIASWQANAADAPHASYVIR